MKWKEAVRRLEVCEADLRRLLAEAAAEGDYTSVLRITEVAKAVGALASNDRHTSSPFAEPVASNGHATPSAASGGSARRPRPTPADYPRFFRRGDELVKVGWSKTDRSEYNHRAPRRAVEAVAQAIRHAGARGKLFKGDALLPLKDPADGTPLPDYHAYVGLAWLRHLGVVEQHGRRGGYTLVVDKQIEAAITSSWPGLPEWRG